MRVGREYLKPNRKVFCRFAIYIYILAIIIKETEREKANEILRVSQRPTFFFCLAAIIVSRHVQPKNYCRAGKERAPIAAICVR